MSQHPQTPAGATERVRISCPGCGRKNVIDWPVGQPDLDYRCFNCRKENTLHRGGSGH